MRKLSVLFGIAAIVAVAGCPRDDAPPPDPARLPGEAVTDQAAAVALTDLPPGVTPAMVQEGQQLYSMVCVACHGSGGSGTQLGPALNDQNWIHVTGQFEEIAHIIGIGVARPLEYQVPMPARGGGDFTDDQIRAIAGYVYVLSRGG
jgi:mono/diheme cytochrome c family protein